MIVDICLRAGGCKVVVGWQSLILNGQLLPELFFYYSLVHIFTSSLIYLFVYLFISTVELCVFLMPTLHTLTAFGPQFTADRCESVTHFIFLYHYGGPCYRARLIQNKLPSSKVLGFLWGLWIIYISQRWIASREVNSLVLYLKLSSSGWTVLQDFADHLLLFPLFIGYFLPQSQETLHCVLIHPHESRWQVRVDHI